MYAYLIQLSLNFKALKLCNFFMHFVNLIFSCTTSFLKNIRKKLVYEQLFFRAWHIKVDLYQTVESEANLVPLSTLALSHALLVFTMSVCLKLNIFIYLFYIPLSSVMKIRIFFFAVGSIW